MHSIVVLILTKGRFGQCGLRFFPSYTLPPGKLHISVVLRSAGECDPAGVVLPVLCSPSVGLTRAIPHQGPFAARHKLLSFDISVSTRRGAYIPISCGLKYCVLLMKPSSRDFERSVGTEASSFFLNCKTFIVPR